MPTLEEVGRGCENQDIKRINFDNAVKAWERAPPNEKQGAASTVLSHAVDRGMILSDLIDDEEKVAEIRRDSRID